jgi:hypothetical protein
VVAGDDKKLARVTVAEKVCAAIETELSARGYDLSGPDPTKLDDE